MRGVGAECSMVKVNGSGERRFTNDEEGRTATRRGILDCRALTLGLKLLRPCQGKSPGTFPGPQSEGLFSK